MRISMEWLREWVPVEESAQEFGHRLTMAGLELDAIEDAAPAFSGVRVGKVLAVAPHPDADRLRVCQVDAGTGETLNIVCGASNVFEGMRAPVACVSEPCCRVISGSSARSFAAWNPGGCCAPRWNWAWPSRPTD